MTDKDTDLEDDTPKSDEEVLEYDFFGDAKVTNLRKKIEALKGMGVEDEEFDDNEEKAPTSSHEKRTESTVWFRLSPESPKISTLIPKTTAKDKTSFSDAVAAIQDWKSPITIDISPNDFDEKEGPKYDETLAEFYRFLNAWKFKQHSDGVPNTIVIDKPNDKHKDEPFAPEVSIADEIHSNRSGPITIPPHTLVFKHIPDEGQKGPIKITAPSSLPITDIMIDPKKPKDDDKPKQKVKLNFEGVTGFVSVTLGEHARIPTKEDGGKYVLDLSYIIPPKSDGGHVVLFVDPTNPQANAIKAALEENSKFTVITKDNATLLGNQKALPVVNRAMGKS